MRFLMNSYQKSEVYSLSREKQQSGDEIIALRSVFEKESQWQTVDGEIERILDLYQNLLFYS